jgi:hypothetical protein
MIMSDPIPDKNPDEKIRNYAMANSASTFQLTFTFALGLFAVLGITATSLIDFSLFATVILSVCYWLLFSLSIMAFGYSVIWNSVAYKTLFESESIARETLSRKLQSGLPSALFKLMWIRNDKLGNAIPVVLVSVYFVVAMLLYLTFVLHIIQ